MNINFAAKFKNRISIPIIADFVDKDNLIRLSYGDFGRVGRKSYSFDAVTFLAVLNEGQKRVQINKFKQVNFSYY
jgi:hypothetical protein